MNDQTKVKFKIKWGEVSVPSLLSNKIESIGRENWGKWVEDNYIDLSGGLSLDNIDCVGTNYIVLSDGYSNISVSDNPDEVNVITPMFYNAIIDKFKL